MPVHLPGVRGTAVIGGTRAIGNGISADFFRALGILLRGGRGFARGDVVGAPLVAVVNEKMASTLWPGENAIGRCVLFRADTTCSTVVGVVADTRLRALHEEQEAQFYVPLEQRADLFTATTLMVRTSGEPSQVIAMVRRAFFQVDPTLVGVDVRTMRRQLEPLIRPWRLSAIIFDLLGPLAMAVAAIGLYGLVAYGVTNRAGESPCAQRWALHQRSSSFSRLAKPCY